MALLLALVLARVPSLSVALAFSLSSALSRSVALARSLRFFFSLSHPLDTALALWLSSSERTFSPVALFEFCLPSVCCAVLGRRTERSCLLLAGLLQAKFSVA